MSQYRYYNITCMHVLWVFIQNCAALLCALCVQTIIVTILFLFCSWIISLWRSVVPSAAEHSFYEISLSWNSVFKCLLFTWDCKSAASPGPAQFTTLWSSALSRPGVKPFGISHKNRRCRWIRKICRNFPCRHQHKHEYVKFSHIWCFQIKNAFYE